MYIQRMKKARIWTKERVLQSARLFSTRKEWSAAEPSAYRAAIRSGWRGDAMSHMRILQVSWNIGLLRESALKYSTRYEWQKGDTNAYIAAMRRGLLDELCGHMPKRGESTSVTPEDLDFTVNESKSIEAFDRVDAH